MSSAYPITLPELAGANVSTAKEIGFMWNSGAREIHESRGTLSEMLTRGNQVNFILAKKDDQGHTGQKPGIHLGILYHTQTAATCAYVLCHYLAGETSGFLELAQSNDDVCYGPIERRHRQLIIPKSPMVGGIQLIGGGKIHQDAHQDEVSSHTLRTNFALPNMPREHMEIVRRLVHEKLGVEHSVQKTLKYLT